MTATAAGDDGAADLAVVDLAIVEVVDDAALDVLDVELLDVLDPDVLDVETRGACRGNDADFGSGGGVVLRAVPDFALAGVCVTAGVVGRPTVHCTFVNIQIIVNKI